MNQKINIDDFISSIDIEKFTEFVRTHNYDEIIKEYNLVSKYILRKVLSQLNIVRTKDEIEKIKKSTTIKNYGSLENSYAERTKKARISFINNSGSLENHYQQTAKKIKHTKNNFSDKEKQDAVENWKTTMFSRYSSLHPEQSVFKFSSTCLEKYGCNYPMQNKEILNKMIKTKMDRYGQVNADIQKSFLSRAEHYGSVENSFRVGNENQSKVIQEKYGVPYACMLPQARVYSNDSKPNKYFASLLDEQEIEYEREFSLGKYSYDFKVGNTLIEINPFATHNSTWGLHGDKTKKKPTYHFDKSCVATENGYRCIHVWDWDNLQLIVNLIIPKKIIYARNCQIKDLSDNIDLVNVFLTTNHLQGSCRGQIVCYGLFYDNQLVQIMTFGKPRYNKNYEWELLRLCSDYKFIVTGGAEKLFSKFIKSYCPKSIISYCDNSKFCGNVYERLGMTKISNGVPAVHWYNSKRHITDNLLRQRGADQLLGTNYGKGTSNEQIMLDSGFVKIYDCGQSTYLYIM